MRTAARLSEAAMEGKAIIAMYGNAARDILRSAAPGDQEAFPRGQRSTSQKWRPSISQ